MKKPLSFSIPSITNKLSKGRIQSDTNRTKSSIQERYTFSETKIDNIGAYKMQNHRKGRRYMQLFAYLEGNNLLPQCQYGFRMYHSTKTLLLPLLSDI